MQRYKYMLIYTKIIKLNIQKYYFLLMYIFGYIDFF